MADPRSQDDTPAIPAVVNNLQHVKQTMGRLTRTFIFHTTIVCPLALRLLMAFGNGTNNQYSYYIDKNFGLKTLETCNHWVVNLL